MDKNGATGTKATTAKSTTMWDYEAPQYCDFSSADTFTDNDPNIDQFFLTDHENTKENLGDFEDSDSDIFTTPMSVRDNKARLSNGSTMSSASDFATPKASGKSLSFATPTSTNTAADNPRLSTLRQTPLRDIYNNGGTPLHEPGHLTKTFKSGRKSRKAGGSVAKSKSGSIATSVLKKQHQDSLKTAAVVAVSPQGTPNSRRETYDMSAIKDSIEEISNTTAVVAAANIEPNGDNQQVESCEQAQMVVEEQAPVVEKDQTAMYSEDEDEDGDDDNKHEQTVLMQNSAEESKLVVANESLLSEDGEQPMASSDVVQFHPITEQELEEEQSAPVASEAAATPDLSSPNTSRRSSYIVKSPSIRMVHFDENSLVDKQSQKLDSIGEDDVKEDDQTTPVMRVSESTKKIKARQQTPMVAAGAGKPENGAGQKPKMSFLTGIRKRLSQKYIKRFSKSMTPSQEEAVEEKKEGDVEGVAGPSNVNKEVVAKPVGLSKKRVTIAVPQKSTSTASSGASAAPANNTVTKRSMSFKGNRSFKSAAVALARSKSFSAVQDSVPLTPVTTKSPYLGLSVLNQRFMSGSLRHYSPLYTAPAMKRKSTVPKAPNLLTSQRCSIRKFHTTSTLVVSPKKKPVAKPAPRVSMPAPGGSKPAPFVPTKAITPKFITESRIKKWHAKHDNEDGGSSASDQPDGGNHHLFKARPAPNFKRIQAAEDKRKKEALEKAKLSLKQHKVEPFSFEARAHGPTSGKGHGKA